MTIESRVRAWTRGQVVVVSLAAVLVGGFVLWAYYGWEARYEAGAAGWQTLAEANALVASHLQRAGDHAGVQRIMFQQGQALAVQQAEIIAHARARSVYRPAALGTAFIIIPVFLLAMWWTWLGRHRSQAEVQP